MGETRTVGVLAIQGSFALHMAAFRRLAEVGLSLDVRAVRRPGELEGLGGLVIPGGESTVMSDLASEYGLVDAIRERGQAGLPLFGTCAGAILLGRGEERPPRLELAPLTVFRNAYGRQRESFEKPISILGDPSPFLCVFIRAPKILVGPDASALDAVEILGRDGEDPILVRYRNFLLSTFHPELTDDLRVHEYFASMIVRASPHASLAVRSHG